MQVFLQSVCYACSSSRKLSKHQPCLTTTANIKRPCYCPGRLSLSAAAFSNGEIQPHETGRESLQQPEVN